MADHIVRSFDADLDALGRGVAELGGLAESMTTRAIEALVRQSPTIANEVIALDREDMNLAAGDSRGGGDALATLFLLATIAAHSGARLPGASTILR